MDTSMSITIRTHKKSAVSPQ